MAGSSIWSGSQGEPSDVKVYCGTVNLRHFMGAQMPRPMEPILARNKLVPSPQLDKTDAILPEVLWGSHDPFTGNERVLERCQGPLPGGQ